MITVTKSFIPPIEEYTNIVSSAFEKGWLTNRGPLVLELEDTLKNFLATKHLTLMTNGTLPLQIAIKLLGKGGEIITTPFSYVATTSSIVWENCTPVFVDIDPDHLTIDETKIEGAITKDTTCILATHVFGNPCNIEEIERIARKHNLAVIYDAAHSFGVKYKGKSIFDFGDISTCSFHATKIFHCGEGGATFCSNNDLAHKIFYSHNFGHNGPESFEGVGINAKMSELQAAMGLAVFPYFDKILASRKMLVEAYKENLDWTKLATMSIRNETEWNYSYFPVIFEDEKTLHKVCKELNEKDIYPRRYFYPSLNTLDYLDLQASKLVKSEEISKLILCLPLYVGLGIEDVQRISKLINKIC